MTGVPGRSRLRTVLVVIVCILALELLGGLSSRVAGPTDLNPWYQSLQKPALQPPGPVFGLAWAILYGTIAAALGLVLTAREARGKVLAVGLFLLQLAMNLAWSPLFFQAHRMADAFWLLTGMIVVTVLIIWRFATIRRAAALLMLPYLAWLGFASYLNWSIVRLNPDGGAAISQGTETAIPPR